MNENVEKRLEKYELYQKFNQKKIKNLN